MRTTAATVLGAVVPAEQSACVGRGVGLASSATLNNPIKPCTLLLGSRKQQDPLAHDPLSASSRTPNTRASVYVGNMFWWTSDVQVRPPGRGLFVPSVF